MCDDGSRVLDKRDLTATNDLTNPILSDIEDLVNQIFNSKDTVKELSDPVLVNFVTDLVLCDDRSGSQTRMPSTEGPRLVVYKERKDYDQRTTTLRRRYKCQPQKGVLNQYYQLLVAQKIIKRNPTLEPLLRLKSARSHSGVMVITVLTSPGKFSCPKDCYFCPDEREDESDPNSKRVMPRSYLSSEPACRRATDNQFDPVLQFFDRAQTLQKIGHIVDKIELMVLGGTWSFYPRDYQIEFIRDLYFAANVFYDTLIGKPMRTRLTLSEEQTINESAMCRVIGLTLETRPDYITLSEIKRFRQYGCTRVQIGIQHTDNDILKLVNRDHTVEDSIKAIKLLKENGFKVDGHLMPDLPGSSPEKDIECVNKVYTGTDLQLDQVKWYITTITPFTVIKTWKEDGTYKPYSELENGKYAIQVMEYIKTHTPAWVRINRMYRDFPNQDLSKGQIGAIGGIMLTNLRQIVMQNLTEKGIMCNCIRCREVQTGHFSWDDAAIFIRTYPASGGIEYYISVESRDPCLKTHSLGGRHFIDKASEHQLKQHVLYGFVRLRFNDSTFTKRLSVLNDSESNLQSVALIRELHVYGSLVKVDSNSEDASQHFGIGKRLLREAERIATDAGYNKIAVISGVGVRNYYRKRGYILGEYGFLLKDLSTSKDLQPAEVTTPTTTVGPITSPSNIDATGETRDTLVYIPYMIFVVFLIFLIGFFFPMKI